MSNIKTGGPAFPVDRQTAHGIAIHEVGTGNEADYIEAVARLSHGMTLRDYFAAKAMLVHMAALSTWDAGGQEAWHNEIARISYATADALLKARES